jgi:hypothetical protein
VFLPSGAKAKRNPQVSAWIWCKKKLLTLRIKVSYAKRFATSDGRPKPRGRHGGGLRAMFSRCLPPCVLKQREADRGSWSITKQNLCKTDKSFALKIEECKAKRGGIRLPIAVQHNHCSETSPWGTPDAGFEVKRHEKFF